MTPFASVIRDVLHKSKNQKKYPRFRVEKVYFYWTTREQVYFFCFLEFAQHSSDIKKINFLNLLLHFFRSLIFREVFNGSVTL